MIQEESTDTINRMIKEELLQIETVCDEFEERLRSQEQAKDAIQLELDLYLKKSPDYLRDRLKAELLKILHEWNHFPLSGCSTNTQAEGVTVSNSSVQSVDSRIAEMEGRGSAGFNEDHRLQMQSRIPSRFRLKRFLGEGATAQVWLAEDTELHRDVAIKIAHHSGALSPLGFLREARSNSRLKHPSIVRVLEIAAESDWQYLVCEHIDGESLANRLSRESPSPQICAAWIASLADALAYSHSLGVVHRDIKPQNILIDRNDQVHITDFGLAKDFTDHEATHTQTGRFIGTPAYMSPQQASGQSQASPSDDVYALGIVFYKMLTGEVPFRGNAQSVAFQLMHSEPLAIRESHPDTHKDLEILCMKCIEKRPSDRLASAAFLRDELQRFLRGVPLMSRPATATQLILKWVSRNPKLARSLATSFALLTLLTCSSLVFAWKLNSSWRKERVLRMEAERSEGKTLQALEREKAALEKAQLEVKVSDQLIGFMETIFQSNDPVYSLLQEPSGLAMPTLQSVLQNASSRIDEELRDQPHLQSRLVDILGNSYRATGYPDQAMRLFQKAEELRTDMVAMPSTDTQSLDHARSDSGLHEYYLGCLHHEQGALDRAKYHYEQALSFLSSSQGESTRKTLAKSDVEFQLGRLFIDCRDNAKALVWMTQCLEHRRSVLAEDSPRIRATEVAIMLCKITDPNEWTEQLKSMVDGKSIWYGEIVTQFAELTLARTALPPDKVRPLFERLIESLESSLSARHAITLLARGDYASWLHDQGDYRTAYPITTKLIETANSVAPNHPKLIAAKIRFAFELVRSHRFEEASRNYIDALNVLGDSSPALVDVLQGKLWCCIATGQTSGLSEIASKLIQQMDGKTRHETAWIAYSVSRCFQAFGDAANLEKFDAIAFDNAKMCRPAPNNSMWLERLATIHYSHSEFEKAEELFTKAVEVERSSRPPKHPRVADRLTALGGCLQRQGKFSEATPIVQEALDIYLLRMPHGDRRIELAKERLARQPENQSIRKEQESINE